MKFKLTSFTVLLIPLLVVCVQPVSALSIICEFEPTKIIYSAINDDRYVLEGTVKSANALEATDIGSGRQDDKVEVEFIVSNVYRNIEADPIYADDKIEFRGTRDTWGAEYGTGPFREGDQYIVVLENDRTKLKLSSHDLYCGSSISVINVSSSEELKSEFLEDIEDYPAIFTSDKVERTESRSDRFAIEIMTGGALTALAISLILLGLVKIGKVEVRRKD